LENRLGRSLPDGPPIGESWEIVDRPEAQSVVAEGEFKGRTLRSVIEEKFAEVMGPTWPRKKAFPILVKWLDCRERLSLQVHPPASIAPDLKGEPKTENWFIAEAAENAGLIVGLRRGVTKEQFGEALQANTLEACVHRFSVSRGDSILVRSGQVHAIDGGNLILEIQQNSDTTYRVYDWGRTGLDGKPRTLHIAESLRSIDWTDFEPSPVRASFSSAVIADAAEFRIRRVVLAKGQVLRVVPREQPRVLSVVEGKLVDRQKTADAISRGENVLVPFSAELEWEAADQTVLLLTENFC
jgi:mannose-6-phosphate isomerase